MPRQTTLSSSSHIFLGSLLDLALRLHSCCFRSFLVSGFIPVAIVASSPGFVLLALPHWPWELGLAMLEWLILVVH